MWVLITIASGGCHQVLPTCSNDGNDIYLIQRVGEGLILESGVLSEVSGLVIFGVEADAVAQCALDIAVVQLWFAIALLVLQNVQQQCIHLVNWAPCGRPQDASGDPSYIGFLLMISIAIMATPHLK